jgi:acyl-CoA thioester hydrolase
MLEQSRKIYLADTDATGFVYYARYLEWMETARLDFLESTGTNLTKLQEMGIGAVIKDVAVSFQSPIKLGDTVITKTSIKSLTKTSIQFSSSFVNLTTNKQAGKGEALAVFINLCTIRPTKIPEFVASPLRKILFQYTSLG